MSALTTVLDDARIYVLGCDLSGQSNMITLEVEAETKDRSTFRSGGWKEVTAGQRKGSIAGGGFADFGPAGTVSTDAWEQLGANDPITISPTESDAGALAFVTKLQRAKFGTGGKVGDLNEWELSGGSAWPVVRGQYLLSPGTVLTADTAAAGAELGAVAAGSRLYASMHLVSITGATAEAVVTVESAADSTFTSPTTVITFTTATAVTGEILRTDGSAITDTWYRAVVDCPDAAGDDSYLIAVAAGIA